MEFRFNFSQKCPRARTRMAQRNGAGCEWRQFDCADCETSRRHPASLRAAGRGQRSSCVIESSPRRPAAPSCPAAAARYMKRNLCLAQLLLHTKMFWCSATRARWLKSNGAISFPNDPPRSHRGLPGGNYRARCRPMKFSRSLLKQVPKSLRQRTGR